MARKFLYGVAGLVVLLLVVLVALRLFAGDLTRLALVPRGAFVAEPALAANAYADPAMWIARPGKAGDPARWLPAGAARGAPVEAAVFFVHPTSYLAREHWNAPLDDAESRARAELFVRGMASPFGDAAEIWAPRYRQAAFGAFLTGQPDGARAVDLAYRDVLRAFDWFLAHTLANRPIVLVGHSQGAFLVMRLLRDRVAGAPLGPNPLAPTPLAPNPLVRRIAAAYIVGWPVSPAHDLPAIGLRACTRADQPGCVMSWASFAEPAEPAETRPGAVATVAFDGAPRLAAPPLCTNPLTGGAAPAAPASADLGTLVPDADFTSGKLVPGMVPARCDSRGLLLIGAPPDLGGYVLPGNNYHVYDIVLFWANLRADFHARVAAWRKSR